MSGTPTGGKTGAKVGAKVGPIRLFRGFMTVGLWTLASRLLGFVRDVMIAAYLGAGPVAEAFLVAFSLPNMFRRFFAEGAFNTAFVPIFAKKVEAGENPAGFGQDALSALAAVLIGFTLLAQLAMPLLVLAMAGGFAGDERFDLTVHFGRVTFPYLLFISLAALLSGVLNALGRFAAAAAAPVLLNVVLIGAMALADRLGHDIGQALVWAVSVAGLAQLVLVWLAVERAGLRLRPVWPRVTPELRHLAAVAVPAALAGGVVQVNLLVGRQVASFFDGAVAWLAYADRLYQLPLGVVGIAIGVVLLPELSRRLRAGDAVAGAASVNRAAEFSLVLTLPAAVALVAIPGPLVGVLFERGAFGPEDTRATALAVAIYGAGLPAFVLHKVVQPVFFAREDTTSPFRYSLWAMAVNAGLAIGLAPVLGFAAAAIATTVAGWTMLWQLWRGARAFGLAGQVDERLARSAPRILLASLIMGAALVPAAGWMGGWLEPGGPRLLALAGLICLGAAVYLAALAGTRAFRLADLRSAVRR
jgi:putative peptidoglycan lipid II flippase